MTNKNQQIELDPNVWGPNYWFVLFTIAITYPIYPNDVSKKKYYDFIQNLPLFIPNEKFANNFIDTLDKFPVTPYLDSRESFIRWIHFIHNQINIKLNKPILSLEDAMEKYYLNYLPKKTIDIQFIKKKKKYIYLLLIFILLSIIYYLYKL
jgi:hypothetical protein